jgi:hypothetical protein
MMWKKKYGRGTGQRNYNTTHALCMSDKYQGVSRNSRTEAIAKYTTPNKRVWKTAHVHPATCNLAHWLTRHGSPTIYRCFAVPQLLYRKRHQSEIFWIYPRKASDTNSEYARRRQELVSESASILLCAQIACLELTLIGYTSLMNGTRNSPTNLCLMKRTTHTHLFITQFCIYRVHCFTETTDRNPQPQEQSSVYHSLWNLLGATSRHNTPLS